MRYFKHVLLSKIYLIFQKDELAEVQKDILSSNAELDQLKADAKEMLELIAKTESQLRNMNNCRENMLERVYPLEEEIQNGTEKINHLKSGERFNAGKLREINNQLEAARLKLLEKEAEVTIVIILIFIEGRLQKNANRNVQMFTIIKYTGLGQKTGIMAVQCKK